MLLGRERFLWDPRILDEGYRRHHTPGRERQKHFGRRTRYADDKCLFDNPVLHLLILVSESGNLTTSRERKRERGTEDY